MQKPRFAPQQCRYAILVVFIGLAITYFNLSELASRLHLKSTVAQVDESTRLAQPNPWSACHSSTRSFPRSINSC